MNTDHEKKQDSKKLSVDDLTPIAQERIKSALTPYKELLTDELWSQAVLGTYSGKNDVIFDIYIPSDKPQNACILAKIKLDRYTGTGIAKAYMDEYPKGIPISKLIELEGDFRS